MTHNCICRTFQPHYIAWISSCWLLISIPFLYLSQEKTSYCDQIWINVLFASRLTLCGILFIVILTEVANDWLNPFDNTSTFEKVDSMIMAMTYALILHLVVLEKVKGSQRSNGYFFTFWFMMTMSIALRMVLAHYTDCHFEDKTILLQLVLNGVMLCFEFCPNPPLKYQDVEGIYDPKICY